MRAKKSDRWLLSTAFALLIVELLWLGLRSHWISSPWGPEAGEIRKRPAGYILEMQNEVRRREKQSLIWEKTEAQEPLYYYDSILTRATSQAILKLANNTEIHLSENTLVTLEPATEQKDNQIRLRFVSGGIKARNVLSQTSFTHESNSAAEGWTLEIAPGAEINLVGSEKGEVQVEITKGSAQFTQGDQVHTVKENEVLSMDENKQIENLQLGSLTWEEIPQGRLYTFSDHALTTLSWAGLAQELIVQNHNSTQTIDQRLVNKTVLSLAMGKNILRLKNQNQISKSLEIEVWPAPKIIPLTPFPRDRLASGQNISFFWSKPDNIDHFEVGFFDPSNNLIKTQSSKENEVTVNFEVEGDLEWQVQAYDKEGFAIPAYEKLPIFVRRQPLGPPKLKEPKVQPNEPNLLRAPASPDDSSSHWWWKLFLPTAQAKTKDFEAVFEWEAVEGANQYLIEISDSEDFRKPLVSKYVKTTSYVWKKPKLGTYYWRVAAGNTNGKMGVFSGALKTELQELSANQEGGAFLRPKIEAHLPEKSTPTVEVTPEVPLQTLAPPPPPPEAIKPIPCANKIHFSWRPEVRQWSLSGEDQVNAKISDSLWRAFSVETDRECALEQKENILSFRFFYSVETWKPKDPSQLVFQSDLVWNQIEARVRRHGPLSEDLSYGISLKNFPKLLRKDFEEVGVESVFAVGPALVWQRRWSATWQSNHDLELYVGNSLWALSSTHELYYSLYQPGNYTLLVGPTLSGSYFDSKDACQSFRFGISLGAQF